MKTLPQIRLVKGFNLNDEIAAYESRLGIVPTEPSYKQTYVDTPLSQVDMEVEKLLYSAVCQGYAGIDRRVELHYFMTREKPFVDAQGNASHKICDICKELYDMDWKKFKERLK